MSDILFHRDNYVFSYRVIVALAVSERTRRGGVGTALVKKAEEWALDNGFHEVGLYSNMKRLDAHLFYEKKRLCKKELLVL